MTRRPRRCSQSPTPGASAAIFCFKRTDVTIERDIESAIEDCVTRFGRLDCVFNNAGAVGAPGGIAVTTAKEWDETFALMLRSVFLGIKHGARVMADLGNGGSIINTSSTAGLVGGSGPTAYSAAKAGIVSLTANAAVEFAPHRIRVNAIAPGAIRTPLIPVDSDEDLLKFLNGRQPWPDAGHPRDIAAGALYLASDESRFCTGTTLLIDGGLLAWGPGLYPHAQMAAS